MRLLLVGVSSAVLVIVGIWLVSKGQRGGWLSIAFFGLCLAVSVISLLPNAHLLELNPEGMRVCVLFRKWFIRWNDIQSVTTRRIGLRRIVCWRYVPWQAVHAANHRAGLVVGAEGSLPPLNYGLSPAALAELLEQWRQRHSKKWEING